MRYNFADFSIKDIVDDYAFDEIIEDVKISIKDYLKKYRIEVIDVSLVETELLDENLVSISYSVWVNSDNFNMNSFDYDEVFNFEYETSSGDSSVGFFVDVNVIKDDVLMSEFDQEGDNEFIVAITVNLEIDFTLN